MTDKISIAQKFSLFDEKWTPKIIAQANGQLIKLAKGEGELVWHTHDNEDEVFIVFNGKLTLKFRDYEIEQVELLPGEMFVVPKGVAHCPLAEPDTHIMLFEPAETAHTGTQEYAETVANEDQHWI